MFDGSNVVLTIFSVACPLIGAALVVIFRRQIVGWLQAQVPQSNLTKINAAVFVAAFAIAAFIAGWILAVLVPGSPPPLWLSIFGAALVAWIVVWSLLANEN